MSTSPDNHIVSFHRSKSAIYRTAHTCPLSHISRWLSAAEKGRLASSMEVVDILVESPTLELGAVRDYMKRVLTADQADIDADSEAARGFAAEAREIREQIRREENR